MMRNEKARYDARAKVLKAMAHPTRLFIMEELAGNERCVQDLTDMIGADMSTVSKHLGVLKEAGIVEDDKRGLQVFYGLRIPCVLDLFNCIESVLEADAKERMALLRNGGGTTS